MFSPRSQSMVGIFFTGLILSNPQDEARVNIGVTN